MILLCIPWNWGNNGKIKLTKWEAIGFFVAEAAEEPDVIFLPPVLVVVVVAAAVAGVAVVEIDEDVEEGDVDWDVDIVEDEAGEVVDERTAEEVAPVVLLLGLFVVLLSSREVEIERDRMKGKKE